MTEKDPGYISVKIHSSLLLSDMRTNCNSCINPLNAELNPICHLLALLGTHHIFHVSGLTNSRDNVVCFRTVSFLSTI